MALTLYNTLTRTKEPFVPIDPANVRLYVCGPTVYDDAHIGNARPVIVFDLLFRLLRHLAKQGAWDGGKGETHVTYARNITDLDDKINLRAHERGVTIQALTEGTAARFHAAVQALGCLPPTHEPRATDHIEEMKALIEKLVATGHAYVAEGHVLFSVPSMPDYGRLSRRPLDDMIAGARVDVAPYKRSEMDFVLWKPSRAPHEPRWESPAGIAEPGRPGWHIECSAMSWRHLGETFDIHGGGIDLVFPHHENEVAQSTCAFGRPVMANVWMHNGFLQVEGQKMSKSLGNFVTIDEHFDGWQGFSWTGDAMRLAMLTGSYRQPIDWTRDRLLQSVDTLNRWAELLEGMDPAADETVRANFGSGRVDQPVLDALADDLNTSKAIARLHVLAGEVARSGEAAVNLLATLRELLGLDPLRHKAQWRASILVETNDAAIQPLLAARLAARRAKNFAESDRLRDELLAMGVRVKDGKDPATGEPTTTWEFEP